LDDLKFNWLNLIGDFVKILLFISKIIKKRQAKVKISSPEEGLS